MIKKLHFKKLLLMALMLVGAGSAWADDVYYTLDGTVTGGSNGYAEESAITQGDITWEVMGNTMMNPWRIGGKSLDKVDRPIYSTTPMGAAITEIKLEVGTASSITVNSLKLYVADNADFTDASEISADFEASSTISFKPASGNSWAKDSYYKIVFNVSVTGTSNKYLEFKKAEFYAPSGSFVAEPTFSPAAGEVTPGSQVTLTQNDAEYIIYTTDGTDPTWEPLHGTEYTAPIVINAVTTIKAIAVDADENVSAIATAKYTLPKAAAGISFATESYNVSLDDYASFTGQALTNPHNLLVTYSVTNSSVASINSEGVVTLKGVKGKTTVKATFAGNDEYLEGTASYLINVYNPNEVTFDFTQSTEDYGSNVEPTSNSSDYCTDDADWTSGVITLTTTGKYRWWSSTSGSTLRFYSNDPQSTIVVTAGDGYVLTDITITGGQSFASNDGLYNSSNGKWVGNAKTITLTYNKSSGSIDVKTITVGYSNKVKATVTSAGWATWAAPCPVSFGTTNAYIVESDATMTKVANVPAGTAVLLEGEGEKTFDVVTSSTTNVAANCLKVSDGTAKDGIYVLANGSQGVGFYKWAGEALSKGKVYLELPSDSRSFIGLGGETTGIDNVNANVNDNSYFDLQGRRVAQPTKGLYIVNGKKVILK